MLFELKMHILKSFGFQYNAARLLGIRDDDLSAFLRGRKELTAEQLERLRNLLKLDSKTFAEIINEKIQNEDVSKANGVPNYGKKK